MGGVNVRGKRVAFFGGSFDPPHIGHLEIARAARNAMRLDVVLFAPVGTQPLKPQGASARFADRAAMTGLAVEGEAGFALSLADAPRASGEPNYSIDTLEQLKGEIGPEGVLFCLMGADTFAGLACWHAAAEVPFAAEVIVASRPGQNLEVLGERLPKGLRMELDDEEEDSSGVRVRYGLLRNEAGETAALYLLVGLDLDVSASEIRRNVHGAEGAAAAGPGLLPPAVAEYIDRHELYR